jgi:dTDP-4-amino-4,6-dideoxygalactose transaminase/glycosyltransferase involved in cell wall biosynthesis
MNTERCRLGIVIPVYGNEGSLRILYQRILEATKELDVDLTIQFVNDRSPDNSQAVLEALTREDPRVRVMLLSRNHGSFVAISAGLTQLAGCDAVVLLAADLQDPPETIPALLAEWRKGRKVVLAVRRQRADPPLSRLFSRAYHWLYRRLVMPDMPEGGFDFCLIDRQVVQVIRQSAEKKTSLVGLILWAGFERGFVPYDRAERTHGKSMWSFAKKLNYALDSIVAFSALPLKTFTMLGFLMVLVCMLGILYVFGLYLYSPHAVPGWSSVILTQLFTGAFQFLGLGLLGEYFWNNLEQTRKRPLFVVDKIVGGEGVAPPLSQAVPFYDPERVSESLRKPLQEGFARVLQSKRLILGKEVERFECELAEALGVRHVVGVANGTDALTLALWATGVEPASRVIVPAISAPATAVAVLRAGCQPIFADVLPDTLTLDPEAVERCAHLGARAVIPVHLYGNPCEMNSLRDVASRLGMHLIEDCAQSYGSTYGGRACGSFSRASAFSFYPTKNLGGYGDGGAVATSDDGIAEKLRRMRFYGQDSRGECVDIGMNSRLDEVQAALLHERLKAVSQHNQERMRIQETYDARLGRLNPVPSRPGRVPHLYVLRPEQREALRAFLEKQGIQTGVHYPLALTKHAYLAKTGVLTPCPVAEKACAQVLSLPCHPGMPTVHLEKIVSCCLAWLESRTDH